MSRMKGENFSAANSVAQGRSPDLIWVARSRAVSTVLRVRPCMAVVGGPDPTKSRRGMHVYYHYYDQRFAGERMNQETTGTGPE